MNQNSHNYAETLKSFTEIFAISLGISYAIGFIVVNSYLISLGAIEFELLKVRYITCGLLTLFIIGLFTSICVPRLLVDESNLTVYFEQIAIALSGLVFTTSVLLVVVLFITEKEFSAMIGKTSLSHPSGSYFLYLGAIMFLVTNALQEIAKFRKIARYTNIIASLSMATYLYIMSRSQLKYLIWWGVGYFVILFILFAPEEEAADPDVKPRSLKFPVLFKHNWSKFGLVALLCLILLIAFGNYLYPHINPAIGGGKPISALLIPFQDKVDELDRILRYRNVLIVDQTQNYYYVLSGEQPQNKQLVQISKTLISGIIFNPIPTETDSLNSKKSKN